jgi:hypothetical protein
MAKRKATTRRSAGGTAALRSYAKVVLSKKVNVGHEHHAHMASVRKAEHNGHKIEILTRYEVKIDGKATALPLSVGDDGSVVCHAVPNYLFASAVDLVKTVIDTYPDDFKKRSGRGKPKDDPGGHDHGGHDHGGQH